MSTGRVLWLIWCLAWAAFWTLLAFGTFGLSLVATAGSIAAFWFPVGKPPKPIAPYPPYPPVLVQGRSLGSDVGDRS